MLSRLSSFSGPLSKLFTAIKGFTLNDSDISKNFEANRDIYGI